MELARPYTLLRGDWRDFPEALRAAHFLVTDPPYGIAYKSGKASPRGMAREIVNDLDTSERDALLDAWGSRPALVFGSWRRPRPAATKALLVWDSKGALGMGDLGIPWKPAHQEIYVLGEGFRGKRTTDVLRFSPVQARALAGRKHPHQKPVELLQELLAKIPREAIVLDPFAGSGSTGVAAMLTGHRFIGIEVVPEHAAMAEQRIAHAAGWRHRGS
jgi:DNA modification methylase